MPIFSGPIILSLDHRVKNEHSFIRSLNLANQGQQAVTKSAAHLAVEQEKLQARYGSVVYHLERLRNKQTDLQRSTLDLAGTNVSLIKENDKLTASIAKYELALKQAGRAAKTPAWDLTRVSLAKMKDELTKLTPKLRQNEEQLNKETQAYRYVSVQIAQRVAREKELSLQLKAALPVQQKQLTFWESFRASTAKTFSSFSNLVNTIERTSVTLDRLTRSGMRTINIINKISGALTGKPLLDWEKNTSKAAASTTHLGTSAEKANKGVGGLLATVGGAVNPFKNLSLLTIAAGTALGALAATGIAAVVTGLRNMATALIQTAVNAAKSSISIIASYERSSKSLTALIAQEMAMGTVAAETAAKVTFSKEKITDATREHEKLSISLRAQEVAYNEAVVAGEASTDQLRLAKIEIEENRDRLAELGLELNNMAASNLEAASSMTVTAKATGEVRDFLAAAGPKAAELLRWIEKIAIESPFNQEGVKNSFQMLKSFGFMVEESKRITMALVDWSAATGKTTFDMERVSLALSQIKNLGRLSGQEVMQLAQAGISVDRILAKAMGKTTQEIVKMREDGLIPAQQAIDLIIKQLETDWKGAARDQANTFSGLLSSIQDIGPILLRNLFGPMDEATGKIGGIFGAIQPYLIKFVAFIGSDSMVGKVRDFGVAAGAWVTDLLEDKVPKLQAFAAKVLEVFKGISARGGAVIGRIRNFVEDVINVIRGVGGASDSTKGSGLFKTIVGNLPEAVKTIRTGIETIKTIVGGLAVFYESSVLPAIDRFRTTFSFTWKDVSNITQKVLPILRTALEGVAKVFTEKIMPAAQTVVNYVISNFPVWKAQGEELFQSFVRNAQPVIDSATKLWKSFETYIPQIQEIIRGAWEDIQVVWSAATGSILGDTDLNLQSIAKIVATELDKIRSWWEQHGAAVMIMVEYSLKAITTIFGVGLNLITDTTKALLQLMAGDWRGAFATIQSMTESNNKLINQLWNKELIELGVLVNNAWMGIVNGIRAAMQTVKSKLYVDLIELRVSLMNKWGDIKWGTIELWGQIRDSIIEAWKDISFEVKRIYFGLENAIKLSWSRFVWDARELWENVKYEVVSRWEELKRRVMEAWGAVVAFLTDPQKRYEIVASAAAWVQGIIDKIREKAHQVYSAAYDLAQQALRALRNAFGMHSPSKVGQAIGTNLGQSVVRGIIDTIPLIEKAMNSVQSPSVKVPASASSIAGGASAYNHSTRNYNLGVTTAASAPQVIHSFAVIQALESR